MTRFLRVLLISIILAGVAHAQADEATKSAARTLGEEGIRLWDSHDYAGALVKFNQAEALFPVPTLGLRAAQCLERLGRLVEASERYLRTTMLSVDSTAPAAYQAGQNATKEEAAKLREALLPRIAHVRLNVAGAADALLIDNKSYPIGLLHSAFPIDPGAHKIVVRAGTDEASADVTLGEGEQKEVELRLPTELAPPPAPPPVVAPPPIVISTPVREKPRAPSPLRPIGYVTLIAGGVALGVGVITWAIGLGEAGSLDTMCPNHTCPRSPDIESRISSYDTLRTTSVVTLVAGGILGGAGVALVLFAPKRTQLKAGVGTLALSGTF